jgi:hypothetical protein
MVEVPTVSKEAADRIRSIKPRSIVYLFSGGKDSALALLITRDFVKQLCSEIKCRVYMLYIVIAGNTHPLNSFAASAVMEWHRKRYGFEPMYRVEPFVFQEGVVKWGLQMGQGRWCFVKHKDRIFRDIENRLPRPIVEVDGMSPSDSKVRQEVVKDEVMAISTKDNTFFYAWHPLYSVRLSDEDKLRILSMYEEFAPIVALYKRFGDSLNCVLCPYKPGTKYMKYHATDDMSIISRFISEVMISSEWKKRFEKFSNKKLTDFSK